MGRLRYRLLGGETRSFVLYACVAALFIAGPFLAGWLDAHGLPGAGLVLIAIALAALAAGYAVYSALPRNARSRELIRLGADLDVPYRRRMALPHPIYALPSFRLMASGTWSVLDGIEGHHNGAPLLVFARSWTPDVYEATEWSFCAATTTDLDGPTVQICPRHLSLDERVVYEELTLESDQFDRLWRVRTDDLRFASAVVDQRMMAWLLDQDPVVSFDLGGPWAMAVSHRDGADVAARLVESLDGFLKRVPHAAFSLFGRSR
jgi:hypothetical protein